MLRGGNVGAVSLTALRTDCATELKHEKMPEEDAKRLGKTSYIEILAATLSRAMSQCSGSLFLSVHGTAAHTIRCRPGHS